jgi:HIRAN domain-containing protein
MGLFSWLFGSEPAARTPRQFRKQSSLSDRQPAVPAADLPGPGTFSVEVIGESHYQAAFERICGPRNPDGEDCVVRATLVQEDANRYDQNAVRVEISGYLVGYLPRDTARSYRDRLCQAGHAGITAECAANIRGGWDRGNGDRGRYGVWLDLPVVE